MEEHSQSFDICIVCALAEEANAVIHEFSDRYENIRFQQAFSEKNLYAYRYTTLKNSREEPLRLLVVGMPFTGPVETALNVRALLNEFHPRFIAMTGICAGYREKVALGDLVAASYAFYFDEGKVEVGEEGQDTLRPEWRPHGPSNRIIQYLQAFTTWEPSLVEMKERLLGRELHPTERPQCFIAPVASSMAVQGNNPFFRLLQGNRKAMFLDQEAAAFYHALYENPDVSFLVVKGVCDYADLTKNDDYHEYAARASSVYLLHFIQEYVTEETMPRRDAPPFEDRAEPSGVWNVPYLRNPHFTGRELLLHHLDQQLSSEAHDGPTTTPNQVALTQPQAIKGLGGIGKTQIAVEYAYRSRDLDRYTHTFWINAASEEALLTSFVGLAELLPAFSAKKESDQHKLVAAIKRWLEECKQRWLLIFDNADDISIIQNCLPQRGNGSILLTTRANAVGSLAMSLEVETMGLMESTYLLLRRAQRFKNASDKEIDEAGNIVVALDHFPLALDQAGAYIDEIGCGFSTYLQLYQDHRKALLARRGTQAANYPDSVATTWLLSFQKVEQANPTAAELLRFCAFLAPDAIPEELLRNGVSHWSSSLQPVTTDQFVFDQMTAELLKFSLVKRFAETQTFSIHRLVQAMQLDTIEPEVQRQWAERVIRTVNEVFPRGPEGAATWPRSTEDSTTWPQCLRYLDQAQACNSLIGQYALMLTEAGDLLYRTGVYLSQCASYTIAEPLYQRALHIWEQTLGPDHPEVAYLLNGLATLYFRQMRLEQAEPLYQRALHIWEQTLGPDHPNVIRPLNNLGNLYTKQGKYTQAELSYQRALHTSVPDHPDAVNPLDGLATLYRKQGKYEQAEPLYQRALYIWEQTLGPDHRNITHPLDGLANVYTKQGKYEQAEPLYQRALRIREQTSGPQHPDTAEILHDFAVCREAQGKNQEAASFYQRALLIWEQVFGPLHSKTSETRERLHAVLQTMGKAEEATQLEPAKTEGGS
jgi:tetratricopeptide (TPR) repeat protein/nucleoside phosphorylase